MPHTIRESIEEAIESIVNLQSALNRDLKPYAGENNERATSILDQTYNLLEQAKANLRDKIKEEIKPEVVEHSLAETRSIIETVALLNQIVTQKSAAVKQEIDAFKSEERELNQIKTILVDMKTDESKIQEAQTKLSAHRNELSSFALELGKIENLITKLEEDIINETQQEHDEIRKLNDEVNALIKIKDQHLTSINNAMSNTNSSNQEIRMQIARSINAIDELHNKINLEKITERRDIRRENYTIIKNYKKINQENKVLRERLESVLNLSENVTSGRHKGSKNLLVAENASCDQAINVINHEITKQDRIIKALDNILETVEPAIARETQDILVTARNLETHLTNLQSLLQAENS